MRRSSREIAFQILFQSEFAPAIQVRDIAEVTQESHDGETIEFAHELVKGVLARKAEIDAKIQSVSQHWKMERMASVDRNLLRLATYEMIFSPQPLKPAIAINEAVELAKKFGSSDSASFVNGILDQLGKGL